MIPHAIFAALKSPLLRYVLVGLAALAWAYFQGRSDCGARQARRAAKEAAEWASRVDAAKDEAYRAGAEAARIGASNQSKVKEIRREAEKETGGECVSRDTLRRLRDLE